METLNKELIEQLRNGEVTVINDGTTDQLRQVLKEAFPEDESTLFDFYDYYGFAAWDDDTWVYVEDEEDSDIRGKLVSMNEFFTTESKEDKLKRLEAEAKKLREEIEEENTPKVGDIVLYVTQIGDGSGSSSDIGRKEQLIKIEGLGHKDGYSGLTDESDFYAQTDRGGRNLSFNGIKRKATPQEIEKFNKPEVGDLVVVLPEDKYYDNSDKDKACKVTHVDGSLLPYTVEFKNGKRNSYSKVRKATPEEIKEYEERNELPKIGCKEGILKGSTISYGKASIRKETLRQLEEVNVRAIELRYEGESFLISGETLQRLYRVARR